MSASTYGKYYYESKSESVAQWMICNHAEECSHWDCEWFRPKRYNGNIAGNCTKRDILVKVIPYVADGKKDPNVAFRMRKK